MHPIEIAKVKRLAMKKQETFSGMLSRLVQDCREDYDDRDLGDLTELSYELHGAPKKRKMTVISES